MDPARFPIRHPNIQHADWASTNMRIQHVNIAILTWSRTLCVRHPFYGIRHEMEISHIFAPQSNCFPAIQYPIRYGAKRDTEKCPPIVQLEHDAPYRSHTAESKCSIPPVMLLKTGKLSGQLKYAIVYSAHRLLSQARHSRHSRFRSYPCRHSFIHHLIVELVIKSLSGEHFLPIKPWWFRLTIVGYYTIVQYYYIYYTHTTQSFLELSAQLFTECIWNTIGIYSLSTKPLSHSIKPLLINRSSTCVSPCNAKHFQWTCHVRFCRIPMFRHTSTMRIV